MNHHDAFNTEILSDKIFYIDDSINIALFFKISLDTKDKQLNIVLSGSPEGKDVNMEKQNCFISSWTVSDR